MIGSGLSKIKLVALEEPNSVYGEMYRSIRTNIEYSSIDKKIKLINVTSTVANEAKSTTACNMAVMAANKYKHVLLIDLDLRSPSIHRIFGIKNQLGITDLLLEFLNNGEKTDLNQYIQPYKHENLTNNLYILTGGTEVVNPVEILSSNKLKELLSFLKSKFDEIIIDSAPSGIITDGVISSTICDGTVFIVESGKTKIDLAQKTVEMLKTDGATILGTILTKVPNKMKSYGYYYGYGNNKDSKNRIKIDVE